MSSLCTIWHLLTLEELISLTSCKYCQELTHAYQEKIPPNVQVCMNQSANDDTGIFWDKFTPPVANGQDDLNSYIILRWCPWFSRTFGILSDSNLYMLTVRLLRLYSEQHPILLELIAAVALVLTQPNVPYDPICQDRTIVERYLFAQSWTI